MFPIEILRWLLVLASSGMAGRFVLFNLGYLAEREGSAPKLSFMAAVAAYHFVFAVLLKFYFFAYGSS